MIDLASEERGASIFLMGLRTTVLISRELMYQIPCLSTAPSAESYPHTMAPWSVWNADSRMANIPSITTRLWLPRANKITAVR